MKLAQLLLYWSNDARFTLLLAKNISQKKTKYLYILASAFSSPVLFKSNQIKSNCTFIRRLSKSDFSQAPPTSVRAQTRQFLTIAWIVPVRCLRSSDCQADCSTLWGRKHGSFWVQNGQCVCVRWSVLHGQRIVVGNALEPSPSELCLCRKLIIWNFYSNWWIMQENGKECFFRNTYNYEKKDDELVCLCSFVRLPY